MIHDSNCSMASFSERFFDTVIKECPDVSFDKQKLTTQYKFKEEEIQ